MVSSRIPLTTDQIYHIFNRGARKGDIFFAKKDYQRWHNLLHWCQTYDYSYSMYLHRIQQTKMCKRNKQDILEELNLTRKFKQKPVEILAHVEMSNHFHLLLKQTDEDGILKFMHKLQTSYAKYFNLLHNFKGSLFESMYKTVLVRTDEQFLQLFRYIHLNPLAAGLVTKANLINYPWSSLPSYMEKGKELFLSKQMYLEMFNNNKARLWQFIISSVEEKSIATLYGLTHDDDFNWYKEKRAIKQLYKKQLIERSLKGA